MYAAQMSLSFRLAALTIALPLSSLSAWAQAVPPPDTVKLPAGLDLGGSSFYDGFGPTDPSIVFIDFARYSDLTSVRDNSGRKSSQFVDPHIDTYSNLFQLIYITPWRLGDGAFTVEALMPIVGFDTHFNPSGIVLHDNGWSVGDLTFGVDY